MQQGYLAEYDAVNLAKTLFMPNTFCDSDLQRYNSVKIIRLQKQRKDLGLDIPLAMKTGDTDTLDRCITEGVWIPTFNHLYHAVHNNLNKFLLYLQGKITKVPPARYIHLLHLYDHSYFIVNILSSHPDWKPRQCDIDDATRHGNLNALAVYVSVDPNMSPPAETAITSTLLSKNWSTFGYCLKIWPHAFDKLESKYGSVEQIDVIWCVEQELHEVIMWRARIHPSTFLPHRGSLNKALASKWFSFLDWCASINSAWTIGLEQLNFAMEHGDDETINWCKSKMPSCGPGCEAAEGGDWAYIP
jgi:hypothetical protein